MAKNIVVAIDGPAGSGKSTVAKELARRLGFRYMDTGAMYRAMCLRALQKGVDLTDENALVDALGDTEMELKDVAGGLRVFADGADVTDEIRQSRITEQVFHVAGSPRMRALLHEAQRAFAEKGPTVAEGRDMTTVVFPDAPAKIFLDADVSTRAKRRWRELVEKGEETPFDEVLENVRRRDGRDTTREVNPLKRADDAIYVDTSTLTIEQVVERLKKIVREKLDTGESRR